MEIKSHKIGKSHVVFLSNTRGSYTITRMNGDRVELISVYHSLGFTQREIVMFLAQKQGYMLSEYGGSFRTPNKYLSSRYHEIFSRYHEIFS